MEFALSADQRLMQASLAGTLARAAPLERVRAVTEGDARIGREIWRALAELGVPGLLIAPERGGLGLGLLDVALVAEAVGYAAAPAPFLAAAVLAPLALAHAPPALQARWLPGLASGEMRAGAAIHEAIAGARDRAGVKARSRRLDGKSLFALDAADAALLLVADAAGGLHFVEAGAPGLEIIPLETIDRTRAASEVRFAATPAEPLPGASLARLRDAAWIVLAADMLGAAQGLLDKAVAYAKERRQFGRLIGSFQAVKHMAAEMAARLEPCRALVWYAAYAFDALPDEAPLMAAHAKAHLSETARFVARTAIEVHGGYGFTDLAGLHLAFKRIGFDRQLFGGPEQVRLAAARLQGLAA
jgi:alkylation response protein AidB-like acyl-CoA dehydrogenase